MTKTGRRSVLKSFLALPFVPSLVSMRALTKSGTSDAQAGAEYEHKYLAVRVLRHINTVQAFFLMETGKYARVEEFKSSEILSKFLESGRAERAGQGATFYASLRFGEKEIVPGWQLALNPNADRLRYLASVSPSDADKFPTFATDERGIIHEGRPLEFDNGAHSAQIEELLNSAEPIRTHPMGSTGRLRSFLSSLAFAPRPWICPCLACTGSYPCCCDSCCTCQEACPGGGFCCLNCGCISCPWCVGPPQ